MRRTALASVALGLFAGAFFASSCSYVVDAQVAQCIDDSDCADRGHPSLVCVESLCAPKPAPPDPRFDCRFEPWELPVTQTVDYGLRVTHLMGALPYEGMTLRVCPSFDRDCSQTLQEAETDANGEFSVEFPVGFRGRLAAEPKEGGVDFMPFSAYIFPPPSDDPDVPKRPDLVVASLDIIRGLAALDDATVVPGTGHVIFTAIDCLGEGLEDVEVRTTLTQDETWRVYVGTGGQPDPRRKATGPSGKGAILNVPPGYLRVIAEHPVYGKIFEQSVIVTADAIVSVPVLPSPVPDDATADNEA